MKSVADLLSERHQLVVGHVSDGFNRFGDAGVESSCEQIEKRIFDLLVLAGEPTHVGYTYNGIAYVVRCDYSLRFVESVELASDDFRNGCE